MNGEIGRFKDIKARYSRLLAKRDNLLDEKEEYIEILNKWRSRHEKSLEARTIIQDVAQKTQQNLEVKISTPVTNALAAVFPNPYQFHIRFEIRRGQTECDIYLTKPNESDEEIDPMSATSGGSKDIISLVLFMIFKFHKQTRNTLILDEPFRFLSEEFQPAAGEMLRELSEKLGIQIIMVSHNIPLFDQADKLIQLEEAKKKAKFKRK